MRVIALALVVSVGISLYVATTDRESAIPSPTLPGTPLVAEVLREPEHEVSWRPVINVPMQPEEPPIEISEDRPAVIHIGEPMDPRDPSTWPQSDNNEVIHIGEPMDPDDPYTWSR